MAAESWENTSESENYINQALAKTSDPDVLVAAYRYFFYKNNYRMALITAVKVRDKIKEIEKLPDDWDQVKSIIGTRKDDPHIRLFLNAYSASGLVLAKLGEIEEAKKIGSQIQEIDDKNEFGAELLIKILTHPDED